MAFRLLNGGASPANCARKMAGPLIDRIARPPEKARGNYGKSRSFAAPRRSFSTRASLKKEVGCHPMVIALLLVLQLGTPPIYDRVILGGHVMDPASQLDAVRNIGITGGRIAVITTNAIRGRDTVDARGLVVAPGFIDLHAHGPTPAATRDELLAVFRVAARTKTPIHVHIRPGVAGLKEALALAAETHAPLHVVHINSAGLAETPVMLEMIGEARAHGRDVTTEAYPYDAGMTEIQSATIQDVYKTAPDERLAELEWARTGERLNRESFARYSRIGGPVVVHTNTEPMVAVAITSPLTIIASDAYWQDGTGHPRTTGTFARVLGRYVREAQANVGAQHAAPLPTDTLSLMNAIRKMTLMPAQRLEARVPAMRQKGRLRVGADADITIFDATKVLDRSTYREPALSPVGIQHVSVNRLSVVANAQAVERL